MALIKIIVNYIYIYIHHFLFYPTSQLKILTEVSKDNRAAIIYLHKKMLPRPAFSLLSTATARTVYSK